MQDISHIQPISQKKTATMPIVKLNFGFQSHFDDSLS